MDRDIRALERAIMAGDREAALRWYAAKLRQGDISFAPAGPIQFEYAFPFTVGHHSLFQANQQNYSAEARAHLPEWDYANLRSGLGPEHTLYVWLKIESDPRQKNQIKISAKFSLIEDSPGAFLSQVAVFAYNPQDKLQPSNLRTDERAVAWLEENEYYDLDTLITNYLANQGRKRVRAVKKAEAKTELYDLHNTVQTLRRQLVEFEDRLADQIIKKFQKKFRRRY